MNHAAKEITMIERAVNHLKSIVTYEIKNPVFLRQMGWTLVFWVFMMTILFINIHFMNEHFPDPPQPPDLILDAVGPSDTFIALGEIFSFIQISIMFLFFLSSRERFRRLPHLLALVAFVYLLRAYVILLTPLGQIRPPSENYSDAHLLAKYFYYGMFYSGHSANAMTQVLFFRNDYWRGRRISWYVLPFAIGQMASLLISHQHYSIDVFGAIFVAYFAVTFDFRQIIPPMLKHNRFMPWYVPEPVIVNATSMRDNGFRPGEHIEVGQSDEKTIKPISKGQQDQL